MSTTREQCPACKDKLVNPRGPLASDYLLIGPYPGEHEIKTGQPWSGWAGEILASELQKVGLHLDMCRHTNIWLHLPNDNPQCWDFCVGRLMKELQGRKYVLLMGSDTVSFFTEYNLMQANGMQIESDYLPGSVEVAVISVNPAQALYGAVGELRFALENFRQWTLS